MASLRSFSMFLVAALFNIYQKDFLIPVQSSKVLERSVFHVFLLAFKGHVSLSLLTFQCLIRTVFTSLFRNLYYQKQVPNKQSSRNKYLSSCRIYERDLCLFLCLISWLLGFLEGACDIIPAFVILLSLLETPWKPYQRSD